jgi:multimeric flavodoxin WrbA
LKKSPASSSSELIAREILTALADHDVDGELARVVDHDVRFGVSLDDGDGDGWPVLRTKLMDADILVIATPIWMGQPASVCKMVSNASTPSCPRPTTKGAHSPTARSPSSASSATRTARTTPPPRCSRR